MLQLFEKRILITGASSGIGKQLAIELAGYNARLILVSRNLERLKDVAEIIEGLYPENHKPVVVACDVTIEAEVEKAVNKVLSVLGGVDILINNAGIGVYGPLHKTTLADFKKVMDVNFYGAVNFTLQLLPSIIKNKSGCIVFISSVASIYGIPCYSTYSASKMALHSLSQNINTEFASQGICSLHISPDYTESQFFKNEKLTGGAHYHTEKYRLVEKTTQQIIQKIIHRKTDPVLSFRGKMLRVFAALFPQWIQYYFSKNASKLIFKTS